MSLIIFLFQEVYLSSRQRFTYRIIVKVRFIRICKSCNFSDLYNFVIKLATRRQGRRRHPAEDGSSKKCSRADQLARVRHDADAFRQLYIVAFSVRPVRCHRSPPACGTSSSGKIF
jgi:hypothetical protein